MPYADPEKRLEASRAWRKRVMPQGYGKWLYARRKLRFDDAERFRLALISIAEAEVLYGHGDSAALNMQQIARDAIAESERAEAALGPWEGGDHDEGEG